MNTQNQYHVIEVLHAIKILIEATNKLIDEDLKALEQIAKVMEGKMKMLIRCKFLKDGKPSGRDYTYRTSEAVKVGDVVQLPSSAKGVVTEIDVPEAEVSDFADRIKSIVGKVETKMVMRNWRVVNVVSHTIQAPELRPKYLKGDSYGNPEFEDGKEVTTSPIEKILDRGDHKEIVTRTGSRYLVYPQDVNPEAEKEYPRYYERLKIEE